MRKNNPREPKDITTLLEEIATQMIGINLALREIAEKLDADNAEEYEYDEIGEE